MNSLVIYPAFLDFQEVLIIMVVAVVIFGPDKIPEIARGLGSAVRKLKEASEDIKQEIMNPVQDINPVKDVQNTIKELNPMNEIKDSFQKINPMDDFQKSFDEVRNPINEIHETIHEQNVVDKALEKPTTIQTNESVVDHTTDQVVNEVEIPEEIIEKPVETAPKSPVDEALGLGGSVSR